MTRPLALLLALALASAPFAQETKHDEDGPLVLDSAFFWPTDLDQGYAPLFLTLTNRGETSMSLDVVARLDVHRGEQHRVETSLRLDPGTDRSLELLLPCFNHGDASWDIEVDDGFRDVDVSHYFSGHNVDPIVHVLEVLPTPGRASDWADALATREISVGGTPTPNVNRSEVTFANLPLASEAYSSLDWVVLDAGQGWPPDSRLAPLLRWARLGGRLVLQATDVDALAAEHEVLGPWLESRFELARERSVRVQRFGLGELYLASTDDLGGDPRTLAALVSVRPPAASWVPNRFRSLSDLLAPVIPGLEELPYSSLVLLLAGFAVLVGPANFYLARRLGRPHLTLVTIPALAALCSVALVGVAFTFQGTGVKLASESLALLDQRAHHVDVAEVRELYAGLSPGAGLRPGSGTSCYPGYRDPNTIRNGPEYQVYQQDGILLSGEFLPTRTATRQLLLTDRSARARLSFELGPGESRVTNALGADVEELWLRDASGGFWHATDLAEGEAASLRAASVDDADAGISAALDPLTVTEGFDRIPPATYVARLASPAFRDDCGIGGELLEGRQRVLGLLDPAEVQPR